jgi:hypothetical protein
MLEKLRIKHEQREKNTFYASDYGKSALDLFFAYHRIRKTNPPEWYDCLKMGAGSGAEVYMLQALKDSGVVDEYYDQDYDGRVEFEVNGFGVTGYMDAVTKEGFPVEIKTINNKNAWDIKKYEENKPRENYVGQLAIYMHFRNVDTGYLFVASIDGLNRFWFECKKISDGVYQCGDTVVDLKKEFERWSKIYGVMKYWHFVEGGSLVPEEFLWENRYKIPVEEIDWETVSAGDISKARNGHKVLGNWEILYSDWKDLIVKLQGAELGYTPEELIIIKDKTAGYSTWSKK